MATLPAPATGQNRTYRSGRQACWTISLVLLLSSCGSLRPPNRYDSAGRRTGIWREYYDAAETIRVSKGHYRAGRPVGRWVYWHPAGYRSRVERYRAAGRVQLREFHPNGRRALRGQARLELSADTAHYYWFGIFTRYDTLGRPSGREIYQRGILSQQQFLNSGNKAR